MSPEAKREKKSARPEDPIESMLEKCKRYGKAYDMVTRGYDGKESGYGEEVERLRPEIIELTANNLVKAEPVERKKIIEQAIDSINKGTWHMAHLDYIETYFVKDTLLRVLEIIASNKDN